MSTRKARLAVVLFTLFALGCKECEAAKRAFDAAFLAVETVSAVVVVVCGATGDPERCAEATAKLDAARLWLARAADSVAVLCGSLTPLQQQAVELADIPLEVQARAVTGPTYSPRKIEREAGKLTEWAAVEAGGYRVVR